MGAADRLRRPRAAPRQSQTVTDTLEYRGRFRGYPGALPGMKAPQYAAWVFAQLGAQPGDELADLYPGSGAVTEAWRRYTATAAPDDTSAPPAAGVPAGRDESTPPLAGEILHDTSRGSLTTAHVDGDTSPGPNTPAAASTGDTSPCADCFGYGEPCAACVAAAGDPRPEEFAVGDLNAGTLVEGTRRCSWRV